jgi:probable F420-dependent oxidoreductase
MFRDYFGHCPRKLCFCIEKILGVRLMKIGIVYPQIELGGDPRAVTAIGQAVEDLGFDHLVAYDHVLGAVHTGRAPALIGPYTEHDPFHEPLVMFAFLAGLTQRIHFATGVLVLPQRQTALVARQVADLDLLSGGRFRLGVGVGWNHVEYSSLGLGGVFVTRGARQEEQIGLLRRLWNEDVVEFNGRFDQIDRASTLPRPKRRIPIWLGGSTESAMRRAARVGDGFMFGGMTVDSEGAWAHVQRLVAAEKGTSEEFGGDLHIRSNGDPREVVRKIKAWETVGGTHASIVTMGLGLDSIEAHVDFISRVATLLSQNS